jgi:hypothetical protein
MLESDLSSENLKIAGGRSGLHLKAETRVRMLFTHNTAYSSQQSFKVHRLASP